MRAPSPRRLKGRTSAVTLAGRDVASSDVVSAAEGGGWIAGDDITAQYGFARGIVGTFETLPSADGGGPQYFRLELGGTAGLLTFWSSMVSPVMFFPGPSAVPDRPDLWETQRPEILRAIAGGAGRSELHAANQAIVADLLAATELGHEPLSSGHDGWAALEMIVAVYESHRRGQRVALPLANRKHPLLAWQDHDTEVGVSPEPPAREPVD